MPAPVPGRAGAGLSLLMLTYFLGSISSGTHMPTQTPGIGACHEGTCIQSPVQESCTCLTSPGDSPVLSKHSAGMAWEHGV